MLRYRSLLAVAIAAAGLAARRDHARRQHASRRREGLADVGRHAVAQHGVGGDRTSDLLGREDEGQRQVDGRSSARRPTAIRSSPGGKVFVGTNNELVRDPKQGGDRGVVMAFRAGHRRVPLADHAREAVGGTRQRLAVPGRGELGAGRRRSRLLRQQPRPARLPRHRRLPRRQRERRPLQGREVHEREGRRHRLDVRHDRGGRRVPAQPGELVPGQPWRSRLRDDVERTGRESRQHPVSRRRPRSSRSTSSRASWSGRTTRSSTRFCTASGRRRRSGRLAASCRSSTRRATAGSAATRP